MNERSHLIMTEHCSAELRVAMTRARQHLHLIQPTRLFKNHQHRYDDGHVLATRSRFIHRGFLGLFERRAHGEAAHRFGRATAPPKRVDVVARMRELWN